MINGHKTPDMSLKRAPELLAPCGNMVMLKTAIDAGCDSVYFGVQAFNMRATAKNFEISQIKKVVDVCHENGVKAFLTLNTIVFDREYEALSKVLDAARAACVDAVIAWDMGVIAEAKKRGIDIHLSTQASVSNSVAADFFERGGIKRVVLARECRLNDIIEIKKKTNLEIEVFCHGAMCVSVSGRCFLSESMFGKSANRGECYQPCRRRYLIKDMDEGLELELGNNYVLSPKDLCTIDFIDKLIEADIDSLKIEGRAKDPGYVKVVVESYREAIDAYRENRLTSELKEQLKGKLTGVYNRGFSSGFFMGVPVDEFTDTYGSSCTTKKFYVGKILKFYNRINVAEIKTESCQIKIGDRLYIEGPSTGVAGFVLESMEIGHKRIEETEKNMIVGIKTDKRVRVNDKVFCLREVADV